MSTRQYDRDSQYGNPPRGGAAIALPSPGDQRTQRGGDLDRQRPPPQYPNNYDDDEKFGAPLQGGQPGYPQTDRDGRERQEYQTGRRDQPESQRAGHVQGYNDRYNDNDEDDRYAENRQTQRRGNGNPGVEYWNDNQEQQQQQPRGRDDSQLRNAGKGKQGAREGGDYDSDNPLATENKLLKDELNEMVHHMELLKNENDAMRERLNDSKKREKELEEIAKKKGGASGDKEMEKLRAELEKKTRKLEKLASKNPSGGVDEETESLIESLKIENEKLKKGLPAGGNNQEMEKLSAMVKAKDKLISEINEEKEELMAILEEEGSAEKFKKMKKKSKDLKQKNEELKEVNEKLMAEVAKGKPDGDILGKLGKKCCPNCDQLKKGAFSDNNCKTKELPKDMRPLQELVREQESHILDLQREVDTLRHAINDYQKEIERLEAAHVDSDDATGTTRRRQTIDEDTEVRRELEQSRRKLRSSNRRVAQLEKWLDEIYNDKNFEIVVKGAAFKGRKTTLSLPDIQGGGEATSRKGLGRKTFGMSSKGIGADVKSSRSSFNF